MATPRQEPARRAVPDGRPLPDVRLAQTVTRLRLAVTIARNELRAGRVASALAILEDQDSE